MSRIEFESVSLSVCQSAHELTNEKIDGQTDCQSVCPSIFSLVSSCALQDFRTGEV